MTATMAWLETYSQAGAGLSMVVEGLSTAFATDSMPSTYSASAAPYNAWADPTSGLVAEGTIGTEVQLYAQDISPDSLRFTVVDAQGVLIGTLFRESYSSGHRTYITSSVLAGSTAVIPVKDLTGFANSGTIYIGDEAIAYTGKSAATGAGNFTGITRGTLVINQTDSGANFSSSHIIGNNVTTSATTAPAVTDYPRTWYGRFIHLFLHVKNPLTGLYNLPSEATKVWSGRIQSYRDEGDGRISISAKSVHDVLFRAIGTDQWRAKMNEGFVLEAANSLVILSNTAAVAYNAVANLSLTTRYTHDDVATLLNSQFETFRSAGTTHAGDLWDIKLADPGEGGAPRYRIRLQANTTAVSSSQRVAVYLHRIVWQLLGWPMDATATTATDSNGYRAVVRSLSRVTDNLWEMMAPEPPIVYLKLTYSLGAKATASSQVGTFVTQTTTDIGGAPAAANGVVQINGNSDSAGIFAVKYTAGSPDATLLFLAKLDPASGLFVPPEWGSETTPGYVRLGEAPEPPTITQAWFMTGTAGTLLLKCLLSTGGASGYNHATYDVLTTPGFGAGVPASLIDVASWQEINDVTMQLLVTTPKAFYEFLEPVLAASNRYLVWKASSSTTSPKLAICRPKLDSVSDIDWALTESNKVNPNERVKVERATDGIINRVVVKYGQGLEGADGDAQTWIVEDLASQSDFGRKRTMTLKAPTITNVPTLAPRAIAPALAYFSRPLAVAQRSYNASCARMAACDSVSLTDNYLADPTTGLRGAIVYGWVLATKFDLKTGQGSARLVFLPEKFPRVMKYAPSARVDETAAGFGYDAGTKTLTLKQHEFSGALNQADALNFASGDKVHVYSLDESGPLEWFDTVSGGPSSTTIALTVGLAGYNTAKRYVIEYDDINTVQSTQRSFAFIADDADLSTGFAVATPYDWGSSGNSGFQTFEVASSPEYTIGVARPSSTASSKGEPMSVHKINYAAQGANNLLAYKTRCVHVCTYLSTNGSQLGTTEKMVYLTWIPIYGHGWLNGNRNLVVRLRGKQAGGGTATFKLYSSPTRPVGATFTTFSFPWDSTSVSLATASATSVWSGELTLAPSLAQPIGGTRGLLGTWISATCVGSAGGITATLDSIWVAEAAIP
jgi:hypothetical protein